MNLELFVSFCYILRKSSTWKLVRETGDCYWIILNWLRLSPVTTQAR